MIKKRYWLIGGLMGVGLYACITVLLLPFGTMGGIGCPDCIPYWTVPAIVSIGLIEVIIKTFTNVDISVYTFIFLTIVLYFAGGSLAGFIYGKFKKN